VHVGSFMKITEVVQICGLLFLQKKICIDSENNFWGYIHFGRFFTNSSGRPFGLRSFRKRWSQFFRLKKGLPDFSRSKYTKTGKNLPNDQKLCQTAIHYARRPLIIPNGRKIYQHFPFQALRIYTQVGIFGPQINHLATLKTIRWLSS
jgi:hypothetical protein